MKIDKFWKIVFKIGLLQILALVIICGLGMYMTEKKLYVEEFILVPIYCLMLYGIIKLNNKWLKKYEYDVKEELKKKEIEFKEELKKKYK